MERHTRSKEILAISLVGLNHEQQEFQILVPAKAIQGLAPEYKNDVEVRGTVVKAGRKVHVTYTIAADATLVCDRSLEEYTEPILVNVALDYSFSNDLYASQAGIDVDPDEIRGLREDAQSIDITEDVRQELVVALPMKRIAPAYRDVDATELFQLDQPNDEQAVDERWAALKNLSNTMHQQEE